MKINEKVRGEVVSAISEWMMDNAEFSVDFLQKHGEYWLRLYNLEELYSDYYGGDLADVINVFRENYIEADNWCEYFVDDNGDLHESDDMNDVVSEMVFDDEKYAEWVLEEIENDMITEPQELIDIVEKYAAMSWEDVASDINSEYINLAVGLQAKSAGEIDLATFVDICYELVDLHKVKTYLLATRFCGADESTYEKISADLADDNLLGVLVADAREYVNGMNVTLEKAVEITVKNEYL